MSCERVLDAAIDRLACLDTSVVVMAVALDELDPLAVELIHELVNDRGSRIIGPTFMWAEVGSVLRKKVRQRLLIPEDAELAWQRFQALPIDFVDPPGAAERAWRLAEQYRLPTLYDAVFLACTELAPAPSGVTRELWSADGQLVTALGANRPAYVRDLAPDRG